MATAPEPTALNESLPKQLIPAESVHEVLCSTPADHSAALAGYSNVKRIGKGNFGSVYFCRRASDGRAVAVKVVPLVGDHAALMMGETLQEAFFLGRAESLNIIGCFSTAEYGDTGSLELELFGECNLQDWISNTYRRIII